MARINQDNRIEPGRFRDNYLVWYDSRRRIERVHRRSRQSSCADLFDAIDMIDLLIERHQMTWQAPANSFKLTFPYMFIMPSIGDKIRNKTTNEEYKIVYIGTVLNNFKRPSFGPIQRNSKNAAFDGTLILDGIVPPSYGDELEFINKEKNLLHFFEWGNKRPNVTANNIGDGHESLTPFNLSITWSVLRVEPGTTGKRPFDKDKMDRPVFIERYDDPDNTVLLNNEFYENSKMVQSLYPTGQPMVTGSYVPLTKNQQYPLLSTHSIEVYGQYFDNLVQFDCWSIDNAEANSLILWFEDFMQLHIPALKENGVDQILFWERMRDQTIERWRDDIDNRTVVYYFRTQTLKTRKIRNFRKYKFTIQVGTSDSTLVVNEPLGINTESGQYGLSPHDLYYYTGTGVSGLFTGDTTRLWGTLNIME